MRLVSGTPFNAPSDTRVLSRKKALLQSTVNLTTLPRSYHSNTTREQTLLDFIEHFRRQFYQLYPTHQPLLLSPLNECHTRKFVCTSVLPTLLPFPELYELAACAAFVSDFFTFLPLDEKHTLPDLLASLSSIVATRHGDCLDLSVVLCSLLRGAGYNAYVVAGEAEGWVARGDQTSKRCPLLRDEAEEKRVHDEEVERKAADDRTRNRYLALVADKPSHISQFQQRRQREAQQRQQVLDLTPEEAARTKERRKKQAHAWVLVLPGRRDVATQLFVESSTGTVYDVRSSAAGVAGGGVGHPYLSVSSLWCDENYWVNIQSAGMDAMQFELGNRNHWLTIIQQAEPKEVKPPVGVSTPVNNSNGSSSSSSSSSSEYDEDSTRNEYEEKETVTTNHSSSTPKPSSQRSNRHHNQPINTTASIQQQQPVPAVSKQLLHLPASWINPLHITHEQYQSRYPNQTKRIEYNCCTVERYSPYVVHMAGLVCRISERSAVDGSVVRVEERYEHRKDRLVSRVTELGASGSGGGMRRVVCGFEKGLVNGLMEWCVVGEVGREVRRENRFYKGSRVDGLVKRVEVVGVKVIEQYEDRDDRLIYRSLAVDTQPHTNTSNTLTTTSAAVHRQKQYTVSIGLHTDLPIRKLTERFAPNTAVHPETDVVKRTHLLGANTIQLTFATTKHALQGSTWIIDKNDKLDTSEPTTTTTDSNNNNNNNTTNSNSTNPATATNHGSSSSPAAAVASVSSLSSSAVLGVSGSGVSRSRLDRKTAGWSEMTRADEQVMIGKLLLLEKELKVKMKGREQRMTELLKELYAMDNVTQLIDDVYDAAYRTAYSTTQAKLQHAAQSGSGVPAGQSADTAAAAAAGVDGVAGSHHSHNGGGGVGMGLDDMENDYLTPFLLPFPTTAVNLLTRKQCETIKQACLTALKERLLSRANIIQSHLEDEQNKLTQKQNAFKRQAGGGGSTTSGSGTGSGGSGAGAGSGGGGVVGGSDEANEEFQQFSEQCLFRIDILLARRARHEQLAVSKYQEMERRLNNDPRLVALHD